MDPYTAQYDQWAFQTGAPYSNAAPNLGNFGLSDNPFDFSGAGSGLKSLADKYNTAVSPYALNAQRGLQSALAQSGARAGANPALISKVGRFAGGKGVLNALKAVPALGAAGAVVGAGDVLFGGDSAANKVMDGSAMTIGGILGAPFGGPIGAAAGAGAGKLVSDSIQGLGGMIGIKSEKERKLEEALRALQGGVI